MRGHNEEAKVGLETRIIRAMEEQDSLLQVLIQKRDTTNTSPTASTSFKSGSKVAKDDKTIIEELQTSNQHLRHLVTQLVSQLESIQSENLNLKKEVSILRSESVNRDSCSLPQLPPLETPQLFY